MLIPGAGGGIAIADSLAGGEKSPHRFSEVGMGVGSVDGTSAVEF
jgi:hypothetical protein